MNLPDRAPCAQPKLFTKQMPAASQNLVLAALLVLHLTWSTMCCGNFQSQWCMTEGHHRMSRLRPPPAGKLCMLPAADRALHDAAPHSDPAHQH